MGLNGGEGEVVEQGNEATGGSFEAFISTRNGCRSPYVEIAPHIPGCLDWDCHGVERPVIEGGVGDSSTRKDGSGSEKGRRYSMKNRNTSGSSGHKVPN